MGPRYVFLGVMTLFMAWILNLSCSRQSAVLAPPPTPTSTRTSTATLTATPSATATSTGAPVFTATPGGALAFNDFDSGGAECCYTNAAIPSWLGATYVQGTTTEAITLVSNVSLSAVHSMQSTIDFDGAGDLAEIGIYDWANWGGTLDASAAANQFSFWVQASGPVTIANIALCQSSCLPEIKNAGIDLLVPGDHQWHNFIVPLGSPGLSAAWSFVNGVPPWSNNPVQEVFFDMIGPPGAVTVYYDNIFFYP